MSECIHECPACEMEVWHTTIARPENADGTSQRVFFVFVEDDDV